MDNKVGFVLAWTKSAVTALRQAISLGASESMPHRLNQLCDFIKAGMCLSRCRKNTVTKA